MANEVPTLENTGGAPAAPEAMEEHIVITQEEMDAIGAAPPITVRSRGKAPKSEAQDLMDSKDVSDAYLDKMARGFILGATSKNNSRSIRIKLEERVTKRIGVKGKFLVDKLFELADGIYVTDKINGKEVRYYKVPPSLPALIYLLDRVLGKPKQHVEKEETKKGIYVVEHIIKNLAGPALPPAAPNK